MILVAGHLQMDPDNRAFHLEGCHEVVRRARAAPGCLDFALSADLLDAGRVNILLGRFLGERMAQGGGAMLLGRRTYEDLLPFWNAQPDSPFAPALNNTPKYVASTRLSEPLPWPNSTLLQGTPLMPSPH